MTQEDFKNKMQESLETIKTDIIPNMTNTVMNAYELGYNTGLEIGMEMALKNSCRWITQQFNMPSDFEQRLRQIVLNKN
jgi:hypothetical protein